MSPSRGKRKPASRSHPAGAPRAPKAPLTPSRLLDAYRPDLARALAQADAPAFRHVQVLQHLFRRPGSRFSESTTIPKEIRLTLDQAGASTLELTDSRTAPDGTTKLLMTPRDGASVETVLMRYRERLTVCISSQVGCPVGCVFCATGGMGLRRNLNAAEIVDQVRAAAVVAGDEGRRVSNVVYMGMGEPLLNLQAVLDSIRILTDPGGLDMAHRAVSVSTIGIPTGILRLARTEPQVNLALSLHAADDRTRALLVPDRYRHPLSKILEAAWEHFEITHRKLLVEYVLLAGLNDSVDDARRLAALLRGHVVTVNLLAWNPALDRCDPALKEPTPQAIAAFRKTLQLARIETAVRRSKGSGIQAACGQLASRRDTYTAPRDETAGAPALSSDGSTLSTGDIPTDTPVDSPDP